MKPTKTEVSSTPYVLFGCLVALAPIITIVTNNMYVSEPAASKNAYILTTQRHIPPSVLVASVLKHGKNIETSVLNPKCTLSAGAMIQLAGDFNGNGVYRIIEPHNRECPATRFYITMPFNVADELIKNGQSLDHNLKISKKEAVIIRRAESEIPYE